MISEWPEIIYFGGVRLWQHIRKSPGDKGRTYLVPAWESRFDMKALEFDPANPTNYYYNLCDQGIFRCEISTSGTVSPGAKYGESGDKCTHCNNDLCVTEFYDFDVSSTNPNLILGGTQDTGNVLYNGSVWRTLAIFTYGDGFHSLINPKNDNIMYAQFQSLDSTARTENGGTTWVKIGEELPKGRMVSAYITSDPSVLDRVIARGDGRGLLWTDNGAKKWHWMPTTQLITYVIVHPGNSVWIVGTSKGQIYCGDPQGRFDLVFEHESKAGVRQLAVSPIHPEVLFATFNTPGAHMDKRIWIMHIDYSADPKKLDFEWNITGNFDHKHTPMVICPAGHDSNLVYVGTEKGVFRGQISQYPDMWKPYNKGFPWTTVVDLLLNPKDLTYNPMGTLAAATKGRGVWRVTPGPAQ